MLVLLLLLLLDGRLLLGLALGELLEGGGSSGLVLDGAVLGRVQQVQGSLWDA